MKRTILLFIAFANVMLSFSQSSIDSLYLGKNFPGYSPVLFLSGIAERIAISSDGKDIFYNTSTGLAYYHYTAGGWSSPINLFTGYGEASLSVNDSILYIQNSQMNSYYSLKNDTGWDQPVKLWNNSSSKHHLQVTNNGTFYLNAMPGTIGKMGDFAKVIVNGADISFQRLPYPANSYINGVDFYIDKNETYIIFPKLINGVGDLYISYKKSDTTWTNPKSLGSAINSTDWEYGPYLSPNNEYLFFSRYNSYSTYWVKTGNLLDSLKYTNYIPYLNSPRLINNQTTIVGDTFSYVIPEKSFIDDDGNNTFSYSATLNDGSVLPDWLSFDSATQTFSGIPTEDNYYSIKITATDTAGASSSATFSLSVEEGFSSIFHINTQNIEIYPNPSNGVVTISFVTKPVNDATVRIYNLMGMQVYLETLNNSTQSEIDLSNKPKGVYIAKLITSKETITAKFLIK